MSLFLTCRTTEELQEAALLVAEAPLQSFQGSPPGPLVVEPRTYQPGAFGDFADDLLDFHFDVKARKEFLEEKKVQLFVKIKKIYAYLIPSYFTIDANWDASQTPAGFTSEFAGFHTESGAGYLDVRYYPDGGGDSFVESVAVPSIDAAILELVEAAPTDEILTNEEVPILAIIVPNFKSLVDANLVKTAESEGAEKYQSKKGQVQSALQYAAYYNGIGAGREPLSLYDHAQVKGVWEQAQQFIPFTGETHPPEQDLTYPPNPEVRAGDFRLGLDLLPVSSPESKSARPSFRTVVYLPTDEDFPVGGGYLGPFLSSKFENPMEPGQTPVFSYETAIEHLLTPAYTGPKGESQQARVAAYTTGYSYEIAFRDTEAEEELPPPPPGP